MSTLKVDTIDTSNSSGNITVSRPLSGSGASLTALNATNLATGTVATARLGSGTANNTVFLRGDGSWQTAGSTSASDLTSGTLPIARIADDAITLAKMAPGTDGQIITYDASGNPVAVGPGTDGQVLTSTGAGSPPAFEAASGGALRNFIIDGSLTQWPTGQSATAGTGYKSALCKLNDASTGSATGHATDDIPTAAQSNFQGKYALKIICTGTEASMGAGNFLGVDMFVTGSDFSALHKQQMTFSFWAKTASS